MDKSKLYWNAVPGKDWHIYYGRSMFLVAEGPGWTHDFGFTLYQQIMDGTVKLHALGSEKKETE